VHIVEIRGGELELFFTKHILVAATAFTIAALAFV